MKPPLENMKNIEPKKSVKLKSNDHSNLIPIHSNPLWKILYSYDKPFVTALLTIAAENTVAAG